MDGEDKPAVLTFLDANATYAGLLQKPGRVAAFNLSGFFFGLHAAQYRSLSCECHLERLQHIGEVVGDGVSGRPSEEETYGFVGAALENQRARIARCAEGLPVV